MLENKHLTFFSINSLMLYFPDTVFHFLKDSERKYVAFISRALYMRSTKAKWGKNKK